MSVEIIPAPAWLGVVGGGQLGRMFAQAAQRAGYRVAVFTDAADSPAAQVADRAQVGSYDDAGAVAAFAKTVDALTFEFENIPAEALDLLGGQSAQALAADLHGPLGPVAVVSATRP